MKSLSFLSLLLLALMLLALAAPPAFAHARLVKSQPVEGARIKSPARILLTFSEALEPAFSGALLMDKDGRNLSGDPVKVSGRVITLKPGRLEPGDYIVSWHSVGHDAHRSEGRLHFHVRP
jgi:methionine-rich copper-binding protein CopC